MPDMIVTTELLAAYAEGNVSNLEREAVRKYLAANPDVIPSVLFAMEDETKQNSKSSSYTRFVKNLDEMLSHIAVPDTQLSPIPMATMVAAQNPSDNLCVVRCEGIALRHFGHNVTDDELLEESKQEGWLQTAGTIFTDIGKLSKKHGLSVSQKFNSNQEELYHVLCDDSIVIAFVDEGELTGDYVQERDEDLFIGGCPDHVVIVKSITEDSVTIIDSYTPEQINSYPFEQFIDAWNDSNNYMVVIRK